MEMYAVTSILNFQRQYAACKIPSSNSSFQDELLGKASQVSCKKPDVIEDENTCTTSSTENRGGFGISNSADDADETDAAQHIQIEIPTLNEAQQKAADDFLSADDHRIRIVQGYEGG